MANGTDVGAPVKWWEKLLATPAALALVDGATVSVPAPASQPVQETPPTPGARDVEPYLLRVVSNPTSQGVLIGTAVIVGILGLVAVMRRR